MIQAINNGEVTDFISAAGGVALDADGRKRFIASFERRLSQGLTHPQFGCRVKGSLRALAPLLRNRVFRGAKPRL